MIALQMTAISLIQTILVVAMYWAFVVVVLGMFAHCYGTGLPSRAKTLVLYHVVLFLVGAALLWVIGSLVG